MEPFITALKEHPFYSLIAIAGFAIFIFFPLAILAIVGIIALLESINTTPSNKTHKYDTTDVTSTDKASQIFMSAKRKKAYLASSEWKTKRQFVLQRANYQCEHCGSTYQLNTHHIHYNDLGNESMDSLACLCNVCHSKLHAYLGYDRNGYYPISELNNVL